MSCHDYEGVMLVLCTPLQVKCYRMISEGSCDTEDIYFVCTFAVFVSIRDLFQKHKTKLLIINVWSAKPAKNISKNVWSESHDPSKIILICSRFPLKY